jgi:hypothetical protein
MTDEDMEAIPDDEVILLDDPIYAPETESYPETGDREEPRYPTRPFFEDFAKCGL